MTLFLTDLDRDHVDIKPIPKMGRNAVDSNELFIDDLASPRRTASARRARASSTCSTASTPSASSSPPRRWASAAPRCAGRSSYAKERVVFGRPIGQNQGIPFPLADALTRLDAAELMARKAAWLYDRGQPCGREANMAKYLCADAGFEAADRAIQTHGGFGYAEEYHVERYFREARLTRIAPITQEMVLNYVAEHVLGLPRSY